MAKPKFDPDDRFLGNRRKVGRDDIDRHLKSKKLKFPRTKFTTSRDRGWSDALIERKGMPQGWNTWQLPLYLKNGTSFFFIQRCETGTELPRHGHNVDQLRVVMSGKVSIDGKELSAGDWVFIPGGVKYSMKALSNAGPVILYCY
jgi:quercetin dioxygenase-like cupin family protein